MRYQRRNQLAFLVVRSLYRDRYTDRYTDRCKKCTDRTDCIRGSSILKHLSRGLYGLYSFHNGLYNGLYGGLYVSMYNVQALRKASGMRLH